MSYFTPLGNRVVWSSFERVELEDMIDAGDLPLRAAAQALGVLRGTAGNHGAPYSSTGQNGLMSRLVYDGSDATDVTFSYFSLGFCIEGDGPDNEGKIQWFSLCNYDLTAPFQVGRSTPSLDFTGYAGLLPYVWARRVQIEADPETRREWDEVGEVEDPVLLNTRTREYVVLGLSNATNMHQPPTADPGWVKIARATSVSVPGAVVLAPRYGLSKYDSVYEATATTIANGLAAKYWNADRATDGPGLADAFTVIFAALSKLRDGRWQFNADTFNLADANVADLKGWAEGVADPAAIGIEQLKTLSVLAGNGGNLDRLWQARDKLGGYLGSINCSSAGVFTYDNAVADMVATGPFTDGGTVGPWYLITIFAPLRFMPPSSLYSQLGSDAVTPYTYDRFKVYSYTFTPFHDALVWAAESTWAEASPESAGRTVDSRPHAPLPFVCVGTTTLRIKVRFRKGTDGDAEIPSGGWCFTLFGAITT